MCSAKTEYIATILMKSKDIFRFIFEIASIIKTRILHRRRSLSSCKYTPKKRPRKTPGALWVDDGARTHDTRNHNPMLYQLNYIHHVMDCKGTKKIVPCKG